MANLIDKMAKALGFSRMVEAANWRPEERAWVQSQAQDSKVDISNGDRVRLLGLSRKLFYNNAIVRSAIRDKATYSVGSAIAPQANSGDPAWDDAAEVWWDNWSKSPEISERHDMRRLQMLVSEAIDRDGEIFCILTNKRDGAPAVQVVESHRVANPPDKADQIIDGVSLDRFARPLAYHVVEGDTFSQRTSRSIQADLMLHVYEPERPDQVRGYPAVAVALNNLLDRDELLRFEMQAAKIGSSIGLVVQNAQGGVGAEGFFGDLSKSTGESLTRETVFGGGMIPRLKATERIESFMMNRPNEKLDAHLEQYIRAAALGLGLPYEFIWDTSAVGGVAQRFIIQKAARAFAARQDVLISSFLGKLWNYAIANAMRRRELPQNPNWRSVHWQTPRSITVDVGREAAARRDDVKAGLMTLADFFGEQGLDWKTAMQEIAAERQFAAELGVVVGVERTEGATVIDPVPTSPDPAPEGFNQLDCGTGRGGFKPGNACAKGGGAGSKKKTEDKSSHPAPHRLQVITDFEERVKSQDFESILILDGSGNVLVQKDGDERSVDFDFGALDQADGVVDGKIQIPGLVASHNHPTSKSFSSPDWIAAKQIDAAEFRVTSSKYVYVLKRPEKGWPALSTLRKTVNEEKRASFEKFETLYKQGKVTVEEANFEYTHEWNSNVAAWIGAKYERIKR
jgi:lambda family phage portal protein